MHLSGNGSMALGDLAGKRVEAAIAAQAAELQRAIDAANAPEATPDVIARAQQLQTAYEATISSYESAAAKKKKGLIPKLIAAQEKKIKLLSKISPSMKAHAQSIERRHKAEALKLQLIKLQGQAPSVARDQQIQAIGAQLNMISKKEKTYMKQGVIATTIISIVVGVFTFGGGAAAIQGAFQALKQGAVEIAKKLLLAAAASAAAKGMAPSKVKQAQDAANMLSQYPPDPSLPTMDAMLQDSAAKKATADEQKAAQVQKFILPAGIGIAALLMFL